MIKQYWRAAGPLTLKWLDGEVIIYDIITYYIITHSLAPKMKKVLSLEVTIHLQEALGSV